MGNSPTATPTSPEQRKNKDDAQPSDQLKKTCSQRWKEKKATEAKCGQ